MWVTPRRSYASMALRTSATSCPATVRWPTVRVAVSPRIAPTAANVLYRLAPVAP